MFNFFVGSKDIKENNVIITGNDCNHIKNVLRMNEQDVIEISNKEKAESFIAKITKIEKDSIECEIIEQISTNEPTQKITVFQGIPKSDKMEYIIQKSVELGVYEIVPVEMKNCVAKIKNPEKKLNRWQAISESASKQSKRSIVPEIKNPVTVSELAEIIKEFDLVLLAFENEKNITLKQELVKNKNAKKIAVIIGPEGGISLEEKNILEKNGAVCVTLGKRILRTETAPVAILSMILYENEL